MDVDDKIRQSPKNSTIEWHKEEAKQLLDFIEANGFEFTFWGRQHKLKHEV